MMVVAQSFFGRAPFGSKIVPVLGDARLTVHGMPEDIDMAFIDADKTSYNHYYEVLLAKLRPGGLMAIDYTLWSGSVLSPRDEDSVAIAALNEKIAGDGRVEVVILTVRDGVTLVRKKRYEKFLRMKRLIRVPPFVLPKSWKIPRSMIYLRR